MLFLKNTIAQNIAELPKSKHLKLLANGTMRCLNHQSTTMKRLTYVVLLTCFIATSSWAQKESFNWYFGDRCGITFHTNPPKTLSDGSIKTFEGCASISDSTGNLLFYTDGTTIYNREHKIMANADNLGGNSSSTTSGVILKKPESSFIYFVFSIDWEKSSGGLKYTVIDTRLNQGQGGIKGGKKNIQLIQPTSEKIAATRHANGKDIWILTHGKKNDLFHVYLLTGDGIKYHSNQQAGNITRQDRGYMKFSPSGTTLAMASTAIDLFSFNLETGIILFDYAISHDKVYGIEFSSLGNYLYSADRKTGSIYQHDLKSNRTSLIRSDAALGALQNGPDGRIYIAQNETSYLGVIKKPNEAFPFCQYTPDEIKLTGLCREGLPVFLTSYTSGIATKIIVKNGCFGQETEFWVRINNLDEKAKFSWKFNDPNALSDTSSKTSPKHIFSTPGNYTVELTIDVNGRKSTYFKTVIIPKALDQWVEKHQAICPNESIELDAGNPGSFYLWSNGAMTQKIQVTNPGIYFVTIGVDDCRYTDTLLITKVASAKIAIPEVRNLCSGDTIRVADINKRGRYQWSNGDTTQETKIWEPGRYYLEKRQKGCIDKSSVWIRIFENDSVWALDTGLCEYDRETIYLTALPGSNHLWSPGTSQTSQITVHKADTYQVSYLNSKGCRTKATYNVKNLCPSGFTVPSSFTPNGDGLNDFFKPTYFGVEKIHLRIFNRWGELLFDANITESNGWDGTNKGLIVPDGLYLYMLNWEEENDGKSFLKHDYGSVRVVK